MIEKWPIQRMIAEKNAGGPTPAIAIHTILSFVAIVDNPLELGYAVGCH